MFSETGTSFTVQLYNQKLQMEQQLQIYVCKVKGL